MGGSAARQLSWYVGRWLVASVPMGGSAARGLPRSYVSLNRFFRMAKGSFLGVKRGKLGDAVGYNVTNSSDKEKQGWRAYQPVVSNPQTVAQIDQRVKLQAVNNLYRALKPIIQRGWENHKYGDESRRAFLKRALSASFTGPYIEKGSTLAVPIEGVPITYGSLPPVVVGCPGGGTLPILLSVQLGDFVSLSTIGDISAQFIGSGSAQEGDQVTFVFGYIPDTTAIVVYKEISFIVDSSDNRSTEDTLGVSFTDTTVEDTPVLAIDEFTNFNYSGFNYCCLVSVSRNGDTANLRSYAEFAMTDSFRAQFYGNAEQNAAAKRSYRKQQSAETNWPLVPGDDTEVAPGNTVGVLNSATPEQVIITGYRVQNGYAQVFDANNSIWRYVYATGVQGTSYHKWLTSNKTSDSMWNSTAPSGAEAAQAIRFSASNDANAADLAFARWLNDEVGYVGYYLFK